MVVLATVESHPPSARRGRLDSVVVIAATESHLQSAEAGVGVVREWMTRVNPLVLLAVGACSLIGSFAIRSLPIALAAVGAYTVAALLLLPTWRYPLLCLAFSGFAAVTIVYSTWRLGGQDTETAVVAGLRILVLAWPGSVVVGFLDPGRLGDYAAQTLRLPARPVAAFSAALQRFAGFAQTWTDLERTRRARGVAPGRHPVAMTRYSGSMGFALLVQALRGASSSSIAMDARGFASAKTRTWAEPATWTRLDLAGLALAAVLGAIPIALYALT